MPLCFSLSQIPQFVVPLGFCRILKNASLFLSFSIKHIYILWLGVLSEKYFIFFLIALFAFNFLNFHGLHGCVCRGYICVYTCGWGFSPLHVLVPWTYDPHKLWEWLARPCFLFMLSFFWRIERYCRKPTALQSSYRLIWESRLLPLKMLVSCIICFKRMLSISCFKRPSRGNITHRSSLGFPLKSGARSNKDFFPFFSRLPSGLRAGLDSPPPPPVLSHPWRPWAAFSGTQPWCHLEEYARTDRSLVKDDVCVHGRVVKCSRSKLVTNIFATKNKMFAKAKQPILKRKVLIWGQKERCLFTAWSKVTEIILLSCVSLFY